MNWLSTLTAQVSELSTQVVAFLRQEVQQFDPSHAEEKGMNDLVSYVDREAEARIVERLNELLPEAHFITEENPSFKHKTKAEFHWVIDPLDGTTNFMHGLPIFAVSIGLMQGDDLVLGVVHEANRDECFRAWRGGGAYCNREAIRVSPVAHLSDSLLATGFPYRDFDQMPAYLEIIKELMRHSHGLRRMGSAATDLAYVACGRFQGFFEYNLNAWDVAAGALLVREAGGIVTDFSGNNNFVFGKQICAAGEMHPEFLAKIQAHWSLE